jgi:Protein of unknown function (DUF4232)
MPRFPKIAAAVACMSLALVACHSGSTPASASASASPSSSSSPSVSPSASVSPSPTVQRCKLGNLKITPGPTQGAMGSIAGMFIFKNTSSAPCTLQGYPGMQLLDATSSPITTHVIRGTSVVVPSIPVTLVTLAPGARASSLWGYSDMPTGAETCPASTSVQVTPPNDFSHATLHYSMSPCGGRVTVSPVRLGTAAP